jgi:hypothetical protein
MEHAAQWTASCKENQAQKHHIRRRPAKPEQYYSQCSQKNLQTEQHCTENCKHQTCQKL